MFSKYANIEELEVDTEFPPKADFYNHLKCVEVDPVMYESTKKLFEDRKALPDKHHMKMRTMKDFLKFYNLIDCTSFVEAISNCFTAFHKHFGIDPALYFSLPSIAYTATWKLFDRQLPYVYTFWSKSKDSKRVQNDSDEIRQLFRRNLVGGLCNIFHRHVDLTENECLPNGEKIPNAAKCAPNNEKLTSLSFWDFNR